MGGPGRHTWALAALALVPLALALGPAPADPLLNAVTLQPLPWPPDINETMMILQSDIVVRLVGERFIPFTLAEQRAVIQSLVKFLGPALLFNVVAYKEVYPDLTAPAGIREADPAVEYAYRVHFALPLNITGTGDEGVNAAWGSLAESMYNSFTVWAAEIDSWPGTGAPTIVESHYGNYLRGGIGSFPVVPMHVTLATTVNGTADAGRGGQLSSDQASAVAAVVEAALLGGVGTHVEVLNYTKNEVSDAQEVVLEVFMFACRENATVASPQCEAEVLTALLDPALKSDAALQRLQAAGILGAEVVQVEQRLPPTPPATPASFPTPPASPGAAGEGELQPTEAWVPWHLDRIDQRTLPLDGQFGATATGRGVNVYIISSGVLGAHEEFRHSNGTQGSRVKPAWGWMGLDPDEDCPDAFVLRGHGTGAASLCCGLRLGAAKDAIIHSGGIQKRLSRVMSSLDKLGAADDITVIAPSGPGLSISSPCDNTLASHPAVLSVDAAGPNDQAVSVSPQGSCIDLWAPSGGVGTGLVTAHPIGPANYTRSISRAAGAAAIAAGVAAQYLELHKNASATEVRRALLELATPGVVVGPGVEPGAGLLYTNLMQPAPTELGAGGLPPGAPNGSASGSGSGSSDSGGLSNGAVAAIAATATAVACIAMAVVAVLFVRHVRAQSVEQSNPFFKLDSSDCVGFQEVEILKRPDGSEWVLGEGPHGKVLKAMKGGVQVVAVKRLDHVKEPGAFLKEVEVLQSLGQDASIIQLHGACVQGSTVLLMFDFMEGGDLRAALDRDRSGSLRWYGRGKELMLDTLRGLHHLHSNYHVHRGVKSQSVLLGRDGRAKLDVGIAQLLGSQDTAPADLAELPAWAAPELQHGTGTDKSDLYSCGVLLWQLVTGEVPRRGQLRTPEVPKECPEGVLEAIQACMQTTISKRPTARELYKLLLACPPIGDYAAVPPPSSGLDPSISSTTYLGSRLSSSDMLFFDFSRVTLCKGPDGSKLQLGAGSFGVVYKALLDETRPLAAKCIELGRSPTVQKAFLQEAEILWRLRHPNVVEFYGVSLALGNGYILMELMGESLHTLLAKDDSGKKRVFGWYGKGAALALDIAQSLNYLHQNNLTHFDIKPANILLSSKGVAKLADVGLARVMSRTHFSSSVGPVGTLAYMSPELLDGAKCSEKVDIYSFGVLLWEICTGRRPQKKHRPELKVPAHCPPEVAALYKRCTAAAPAERPSAQEAVDELARLVGRIS